jgi:hypothetical protein
MDSLLESAGNFPYFCTKVVSSVEERDTRVRGGGGWQKDVGVFSGATVHSGEKHDTNRQQRNIMKCISHMPLLRIRTIEGVSEFSN